MALETASYVANLVQSNPDGGDARSTADDHLRLIKAVLRRTFPLLDSAMSLSAAQVHYVGDLSRSAQLQLNWLRDGSHTAVHALGANSAVFAHALGGLSSGQVVRLDALNVFSGALGEPFRFGADGAYMSWFVSGVRRGYIQQTGGSFVFNNEHLGGGHNFYATGGDGNLLRFVIGPNGITANVPITGTITSAGYATNAGTAINAGSANTATTAEAANSANTANTAASANTLQGAAPDENPSGNTIARRTSAGYLYGTYFNQNSGDNENPAVSQFMVTNGADNFTRKASAAHVGQNLEARNISGRTGTTKTLSSSAPSGGSNGDIWYRY